MHGPSHATEIQGRRGEKCPDYKTDCLPGVTMGARKARDFQNEPLTDMTAVGAAGPHSVRLWVRTARPGRVRFRWWRSDQPLQSDEHIVEIPADNDRDNTTSLLIPPAGAQELRPLCCYSYQADSLDHGGRVGTGSFETAPASPETTPGKFSVAFFSCHQPFDEQGRIGRKPVQMLRTVRKIVERYNTKFILMMGDQMYADFPEDLSLFDPGYFPLVAPPGRADLLSCTPQEVRRLYQHRYRHFWGLPDWQALQASLPCYPILDDHEVVDNWGSRPVHQEAGWQSVGEGARRAYFDYQGTRVFPAGEVPRSFHYGFSYGHTSVFVMDLRSERTAGENGQLFSLEQEGDLRRFLHLHRQQQVVLLVLSVPVIHLPRFLARFMKRLPHSGEDFSDRWSSGAHLRDRDRFLSILNTHQRRFPEQRLLLLSGDIHIGCVHEVQWGRSGPAFHQLIASPVTHETGFFIQLASKLIIRANRQVATADKSLQARVRFLKGASGQRQNPYGKLNLGLLEIETPQPEEPPRLIVRLFGHRGESPVCVYRSPPI